MDKTNRQNRRGNEQKFTREARRTSLTVARSSTEPSRHGITADDIRDIERELRGEWDRTDCTRQQAEAYLRHVKERFAESLHEAPTLTNFIAKLAA